MEETKKSHAELGGLPDLESLRKQKGITLEQIVEDTKICRRYLQAIEAGDFKQLPGGIYDLSYIRQYARAVDLPESELLAAYRQKMGVPETQIPDPEASKSTLEKFRDHTSLLRRSWI